MFCPQHPLMLGDHPFFSLKWYRMTVTSYVVLGGCLRLSNACCKDTAGLPHTNPPVCKGELLPLVFLDTGGLPRTKLPVSRGYLMPYDTSRLLIPNAFTERLLHCAGFAHLMGNFATLWAKFHQECPRNFDRHIDTS